MEIGAVRHGAVSGWCEIHRARRLTIGSAEGGWTYPYVDSADGSTLGVLALSCLLVGAGVAASWRLLKRFDADSEHVPFRFRYSGR